MSGISLQTLLAAGRPLRSTNVAVMRACSILRQSPLHQKRNNDQDDNQGRENVSASTLVSIDTATRTALHDLVQAPSTHGHWPNDHDVARCPRRRAPMPTTPSKAPRAPRVPALNPNEERAQKIAIARRSLAALAHACRAMCAGCGSPRRRARGRERFDQRKAALWGDFA